MIDFKNSVFSNLDSVTNNAFLTTLRFYMIDGEDILYSFKGVRDGVVFTNKRIFAINIQGITGKKYDITSLPYKKIQAFSFENAGTLDLDAELVLWLSGVGSVKFKFEADIELDDIYQLIAREVLG